MITGRLPFEGDAPVTVALKHIQEKPELPSKYNPSISKDLESIIMKLIQKEKSVRYDSAADLIEDLYKVRSNVDLGDIDNTLEIEDSPTQVIPSEAVEKIKESVGSQNGENNKNSDKDGKDDLGADEKLPKTNKKRKFLIGSAIVAALIAALLFAFGVLYLADFFSVEDVEVPNFVGLDIKDAELEAEEKGLRLGVTLVNDDVVPKDQIIKQDIKEGMVVRKNTIVKVTVSEGSKLAVVPDLVYENTTDAEELLRREGLKIGTVRKDFSELPVGIIISQDPAGGKKVPQGTKVNYVVSKGLEPETVAVPKLVGRTLEEARNLIAQNRLKVGTVTERSNDVYVKGYVIEQSVSPNENVNVGTAINLIISKGSDAPDQTEDPDENNENGDEDEQPDLPEPSEKTFKIDLSRYSGKVDVIVEQIDEGKTKTVYSGKHDLDKNEDKVINISVTGTGKQKYAVYVNKELLETREIDF